MSRFRNLTTALAAAMMVAAPSLHAADFQSGDTKMSVYGFVWAYANYFVDANNNAFAGSAGGYAGSLWYTGTPLDTHTYPGSQIVLAHQPTRFGFASVTPSANLGDISTKIEYDLNGSNDHLRHAYIQFSGWTIGQAWSLWNDFDAAPDTVDWAGPIGGPCYDTPRYDLIQWQGKLDKNNSLGISFEQTGGIGDGTSGTAGVADSKIPTIIGMYSYSDSWGHIALRGLAQNYGVYLPATTTTGKQRYAKEEAAFMVSGDIKVAKDDFIFSVYSGNGLGLYGTGFQSVQFTDATQTITAYKSIGWVAGYTHVWTDAVRSNLVASGTSFSSDSSLPATDATTGTGWKTGTAVFVNTFVKLAKNLEFGVEYVWEQAKPFATNGAVNSNDQPASNNSLSKVEFSLKANF